MNCSPWQVAVLTGLVLAASVSAAEPDARGVEFFEKKIRPVLVDQCYRCHSAEAQKAKKLKGGLLLDSREAVLKGGDTGPALVPGKVGASLLLRTLKHTGDLQMPPKGKLSAEVIADFEKWVAMGAPDPRAGNSQARKGIDLEAGRRYWAFQPLAPVAPPTMRQNGWVRTPIDRFIRARLEAKGITSNAALGRERLIRRACYDLWGLPPTPAEIDAFLQDASPNAYEKLIDRLLDSPHYGERWARHWLDVARFAESGGYEFDGDRAGAFHYRDFVIKALNQDMPYDEFVRMQIAGDQLKPGDFLAATATGFVVAGSYPGQITSKTRERIRYDHLDDMVATAGNALLGLSLGCARCHDHKYDPVPQQDYYRLVSCLGRTDSAKPKLDPAPEATRQAKAAFDAAHAPLAAALEQYQKDRLPALVQEWVKAEKARPTPTWLILDPVSATGKTPLKKLADGSLLASGKGDKGETYTLVAHTYLKNITAPRVEALADMSLPKSGPGRGADGNFVLAEVTLTAAPLAGKGKAGPVKLRPGRATVEPPGNALAAALDNNKKTGWSVTGKVGKDHAATFELDAPLGFDGGTLLTVTLQCGDSAIGRPRLAISTAARPIAIEAPSALQHAAEVQGLLASQQGQLNDKNRATVARWFRKFDDKLNALAEVVERHAAQEPKAKLVDSFVAGSGGEAVYFLVRGEVDRKKDQARPGFLQVLMRTPDKDEHWTTTGADKKAPAVEPRVALARWLTDTNTGAGALLARVIVNRLWQHHLGRGIVATPNDFGVQGEPPTDPELLDYLANELVRGGWRLKPIHKLIMTSAVYVQGGETNEAGLKADPQNRLWWRRPAQRLEAEAIRDALLAVSGTLDRTMYGPGTLDENNPRRSVYLTVKRSQLVPLLQMFDAPEAIQSIAVRSTTTVATQSLALMNSPFVRQRAEKLAQRVQPKSPAQLPGAVDEAYRIALGRRPSDGERQRMVAFIGGQAESYGRTGPALDRALADFCQVLLCLNEFVYVD